MGEAFAAWQSTAAVWADALHTGMLGALKAFAVVLVAWHAVRAAWGALTGNAKRELVQGLWQLALLGLVFKTVENPAPVWNGVLAVVGGLYQLVAAPFGG